MAIPTSIHSLLSGREVEWARIEFKTTWDPEASLKTICAFANDLDNWGGGYIVIGVEEKNGIPQRPLIGVSLDKVDEWQKSIFNKCKMISPDYSPIIDKQEYENKTFLVIWCPGGYGRPYASPKTMAKDDKERIYYIRKGSITAKPSEEEIKDLFSLSNRTPFDDQVNHTAELKDISFPLIKDYLGEINSELYNQADEIGLERVCRNMNLINGLPEYVKPRNVALMFFNSNPDKFFPCAQIDVVQFPDGEGGDQIIEQIFKGPLHVQLRDALRYIKNVIITEKVVKYPDRAEADRFYNYPYVAIEEALANAVYHKAYDEREPIEVRVTRDMIEIISHPGPDRSVTIEGLKAYRVYSRRYRNRRIGDFLKELHLTEGRNTGFRKILNAIKANGSPLPEFETDEYHDYFVSRFFIHDGFYDSFTDTFADNNAGASVRTTRKTPQNETSLKEVERSLKEVLKEVLSVSDYNKTESIIEYLDKHMKISPKAAEKITGKSASTTWRYLKVLVDAGVIMPEGGTNNLMYVLCPEYHR